MNKLKKFYFTWLLFLTMAVSCVGAKTFDQQLAHAYGIYAATVQTAASLVNRDRISVEKALAFQSKADSAKCVLDLSKYYHTALGQLPDCSKYTAYLGAVESLPKDAVGLLNLSLVILTDLEAELREAEGGV